MFEELRDVITGLVDDLDVSKYKEVKDARSALQKVKVLAQALRKKLSEDFKKTKAK
jgi:hypothetical protein